MKLKTKKIERWIWVNDEYEITEEKPNNEEDYGAFLISPLTPEEIEQTLSKSTEVEWDKNQRFKEANWFKFKIKKINKTILDWKNIIDENSDEPMEFNDKNKRKAYIYNAQLIDKILDYADEIGVVIAKNKVDEEKNL